MQNKFLNCAVIGLGVGEQHAQALLTFPKTRLSAVCDLDDAKITEFINKHALDGVLTKSFPEILIDDNIDLVSIASFDNDHFDQVIACLEHGKHVFVEKPLCQTREQLEKIYTTWKKAGLALSSNLILRKSPLFIWLEDLISSGKLGEIYALDMDYLYGRIHKITGGWRSTVNDYSVMAGGGIHMIDLMMRFMQKKPTCVQSCTNKIVTKGTSFRYHDFHATTFHFAGDAIGRITANFGCMHRHQHVIRIFGTKATFIYDDMGARIHWNRDESSEAESITLSPKQADKGSLLIEFVDNVLENDYIKKGEAEFDLMCAVIASDKAIALNYYPISIDYLS